MTIAENKLQENIAEYVLYVWQMQDLLRSVALNEGELYVKMGLSDANDPEQKEREWLKSLAKKMKNEGLEKSGNVMEVETILAELFYLHNTLISILKDTKYIQLFELTEPNIKGLMEKSDGNQNLIHHTLIALYGWLILRMQKSEISTETTDAMKSFSKLMAYLSAKYKEMKTGELNSAKN
ncbi:MAG: DUF4924 family protein [Flavobacteriales bacterium]